MKDTSYYRDVDVANCDIRSDDIPLQVNCTGVYATDAPFTMFNPRGRQDYYLQYVTAGRLTVHTEADVQPLTAGMFVVRRPLTPYRYELLPGDSLTYYWAHFTGFHAGRLLSNLRVEPGRLCRTESGEASRRRILDGFARLFAEFANRRPGFDEACAALLSGILVELARGVDRAAAGPMRKLESVAYLHSHYREEVRVADLAAMEHLSESRYRAVFHQQMGTSPLDYRTALRLQHACQLLALTNRSVTEIAAECGYADPLYFMRIFHQKKQMPPGEFRARAQKNAED